MKKTMSVLVAIAMFFAISCTNNAKVEKVINTDSIAAVAKADSIKKDSILKATAKQDSIKKDSIAKAKTPVKKVKKVVKTK
jgi:hypothetical protein